MINRKLINLLGITCIFAQLPAQISTTVQWENTQQSIDGFGASDAWFSDEIITHPDKDAMLDLLFKKDGGIGLSILRHRITPESSDYINFVVNTTSNDLDFGAQETVGLRFTNVSIPRGATITHASIQFTSKDDRSDPSSLTIFGQDSDDAALFDSAISGDISTRPKTSSALTWTIPAWSTGQRSAAQQTPNIASVVQEIVNRSGWQW